MPTLNRYSFSSPSPDGSTNLLHLSTHLLPFILLLQLLPLDLPIGPRVVSLDRPTRRKPGESVIGDANALASAPTTRLKAKTVIAKITIVEKLVKEDLSMPIGKEIVNRDRKTAIVMTQIADRASDRVSQDLEPVTEVRPRP